MRDSMKRIPQLAIAIFIAMGALTSQAEPPASLLPPSNPQSLQLPEALADPAGDRVGSDPLQTGLMARIQQLEQSQVQLERLLRDRDEWIGEVLSESNANATPHDHTTDVAGADYFGSFGRGWKGFKLAKTPYGDLNVSAWTYVRYLNRLGLDESYTDSFGRTSSVSRRNDVQLNKANIYFKGWIYDPKIRYLLYVWTANTSQGDPAQVVVGGNLNYVFNEHLTVGGGIDSLPGTRSTRGTFPYWLRVDYRTIADEFFRPSFTQGFWAAGKLAEGLNYKVMLGNNLSQLGVSAAKLDDILDTVSASIQWMPTTGEFGPSGGLGDFESHKCLATLIGVGMTHSTEDRQSQPGAEDLNNTQLRLSDGTIIFTPNAFGTVGVINVATYYMMAIDAGLKYHGFAVEGEYYFRWLENFQTEGVVPVDALFDHGFQTQVSAMIVPKTLQAYVAGSYISGQYGNPWDLGLGVNWFPKQERQFRVNAELLYLNNSPVGYASVPFAVGGKGLVFNTNVELVF